MKYKLGLELTIRHVLHHKLKSVSSSAAAFREVWDESTYHVQLGRPVPSWFVIRDF
jgi:hypothetical protein